MKCGFIKFLLFVAVFVLCAVFQIAAQNRQKVLPYISGDEILETVDVDLKGCIQTIFKKQFVIADKASFLREIRNDASRERCLKDLKKIDFDKHTLLGIDINSGYCGYPLGLKYQVLKNAEKKQYLLNITYLDPKYSVCRALSQYDLWLLAPRLPDGYDVKFEVKAVEK